MNPTNMLRVSFFTLIFLITILPNVFAQSLDTGIEFYENGNYEEALQIFERAESDEAYLFAGKSYFALNNFLRAKLYLDKVSNTNQELSLEAKYTEALADFQLKNFTLSLDALHEINNTRDNASVSNAAYNFYSELVDYLTVKQRFEAFKQTKYDDVRFDLMEAAIGKVNFGAANALLKSYKNALPGASNIDLNRIEQLLSDSTAYAQRYLPNRYAKAPTGISYNIGVVLPEFELESSQFQIPQHLYFGIQLAVEEFNSENSDKKAFITYKNSRANSSNVSAIANDLVWNHNVDAIAGPLYSETAQDLARYAEDYEVPMITPLANSDSINFDLNYSFQLNPTFAVQGKKMAQYAVQTLGYDTLAIIAEKGSLGEPSATAFLDESRELGAEVVRYIVDDFASEGYDITEYMEVFDPEVDTVFNYNVDAIYAPFTGNIAGTLINSLLTSLEAIESDMTVLGSAEWESSEIDEDRLSEMNIYYSKTYEVSETNLEKNDFESAFRLRFETSPNEFAYIGYDLANVILETLKRVENPAYLKEGLKNVSGFKGLSTNISFNGTHINTEVKIKRLRSETN
ncbi:ABC transporter substrate-binding protein [Gracilimonas sp.]|uniref:ABC transporter substrate-binding protein n=1 Tax=Gracilimonas sp. TaxID=1974203 RepID=UPI0028729199|nr:ABC transporter substrate-binding protein [Gracilimonas sp.]